MNAITTFKTSYKIHTATITKCWSKYLIKSLHSYKIIIVIIILIDILYITINITFLVKIWHTYHPLPSAWDGHQRGKMKVKKFKWHLPKISIFERLTHEAPAAHRCHIKSFQWNSKMNFFSLILFWLMQWTSPKRRDCS